LLRKERPDFVDYEDLSFGENLEGRLRRLFGDPYQLFASDRAKVAGRERRCAERYQLRPG
jgi:hypothetical protein